MSSVSLVFEEDELASANKWIPGYDKSPDILAKWEVMQAHAHKSFMKVLESINSQL